MFIKKNQDIEDIDNDQQQTTKDTGQQKKVLFLMFWIVFTVIQTITIYNLRWAIFHEEEVSKLKTAYEHVHTQANKELENRFFTEATADTSTEQPEDFPLSQQ